MRNEWQLSFSLSEYELLAIDSDDEESDIEESFARPLAVDIGEGEDEDGTSASNSSAQQQG